MKRYILLYITTLCALAISAQSLVISQSLELVAMSSAVSQYNNQFGRFNNPDLDDSFPYAVVCMNLTGDVRAAKEMINLDLGSYIAVEATNRDVENTILFLVPRSAKNIYITCGEGCEKKLLWNRGAMQSNKVYQCKVEYRKAEEAKSGSASTASDEKMDALLAQMVAMQQEMIRLQQGQAQPAPNLPLHQNYTEKAWDINMQMVWVEGGDFLMGCTSEQSDCESDEQNVRRVTVDGYYIGMMEVTQSQWEKVMGMSIIQQRDKVHKDWPLKGIGADYPMYYVSWEEAMEFCSVLSQKTGKKYTLPTEAQWEYAARGGKKTDGTLYAGSDMVDVVAWYTENSGGSTHPVGMKRPNALGVYDMSGNVWEWCKDWYDEYRSYDTNNPMGPSAGENRVNRGGAWDYYAQNCRMSYRNGSTPSGRDFDIGFRVVCMP